MIKSYFWLVVYVLSMLGLSLVFSDISLAQNFGTSGFESKLTSLTNQMIFTILPAIAVLGLFYAGILAASGDASAKSRMVTIIVGVIVAFLAPVIISWFKTIVGGG